MNTLVAAGAGYSTDAAILEHVASCDEPVIVGDGGAAAAFRHALPAARVFSRSGEWPPDVRGADLVIHATPVRDEVLFELGPGQTLVDLPYPRTATAEAAAAAGARVLDGLEVLVAQGAASFELWTGLPAPVDRMRRRRRLAPVTLELATAGESHGPALVAIVSGLPAGLVLDEGRDRRGPPAPPAGLRSLARVSRSRPTRSRCSPAFGTAARSARRSRSSSATATTRTGRGG